MVHIEHMRWMVDRVIKRLDMYSEDAEWLVLRTGAAESYFEYLRQLKSGPARSFFQIEPFTARSIIHNYIKYRPTIKEEIEELCLCDLSMIDDEHEDERLRFQLMSNIALSIVLCRLRYWIDPKPIPPKENIRAQAEYWKRVYNTYEGSGTVDHFLKAAERCNLL